MEKADISLVGFTGFVGSNIAKKMDRFSGYNTKNINESFGSNPDILIYAGLRAEKYIANQYPDKDYNLIEEAILNIEKINPKKLVLISTIDVYNEPVNVDEDSIPDESKLLPYGANRLFLEKWVKNNYNEYCIIRLPGLFGNNLKKNFIYDLIHIIPFKLTAAKFEQLRKVNPLLEHYYSLMSDGFYKTVEMSRDERIKLKELFRHIGFSALNFTDSRGIYQFYNLDKLWSDIQRCLDKKIKTINMATEPIPISELYEYIVGEKFKNEILDTPPYYNFKTKFSDVFGGKEGYMYSKEEVLKQIKSFVESYADDEE